MSLKKEKAAVGMQPRKKWIVLGSHIFIKHLFNLEKKNSRRERTSVFSQEGVNIKLDKHVKQCFQGIGTQRREIK